jgi:hypothetical protein
MTEMKPLVPEQLPSYVLEQLQLQKRNHLYVPEQLQSSITEMKPLVPEHHRNKAIWFGTFSITEMKPLVSEHHRNETLWSGTAAQLCSGTASMTEMKPLVPEQLPSYVLEQLQLQK